ncbi:fimbria/pilus outer membrane usher protein [Caballeronia sp. GAFFF2]|uniref:fimbria/pilus outer membrane usher protein n=1 Tax=Caballeronia sp. GAFFF2 TaxID=2921741 RepID=UPI00202935EB|nr:fimbria/pilus outer membrane usher protein [Caballeronia sp. GAFFF2]
MDGSTRPRLVTRGVPLLISLGVFSQAAVAQVDITGGSPSQVPNIAGSPRTASLDMQSQETQSLVLEIVVNGTNLGEPSNFELRHGQLYAERATLENAGIRVDDLHADADGWIAVSSIPGVRATYSSARQQALLDVDRSRQIAQRLGNRLPVTPKATPGTGFALNYDVTYTRQLGEMAAGQFGVWNEQRLFSPAGVFDNTGTYLNGAGTNGYTRLDTNWVYSNPAKLMTMTFGDAISGSLAWTRSVRFGGFQIQRDFSLRPDLVTFPLPMFSGSAAVPSAVDLYINGLRQYNGNVAPGPFQIAQAPSLTGAGTAQVVVTDALGRRVTTSVPLYIDTHLLSKGLSSYSAEFGFLRDDYTLRSWSYEASPVFSGTAAYGITDWLTLQAHAEGGQGLSNAGTGAIVRAGQFGVFNAAAAGSKLNGATGALFSLGYQYISPAASLTLQTTHATNNYRDIAALDGTSVFQHIYQATVSVALMRSQSATVSYVDSEDTFSGHARVVTLAYNAQIGSRWSLFASTYRDFLQRGVWGGSIGITIALGGNTSVSTTVAQSGGHTTADVTASRPADYGGGWGWSVQGGAGADYRHAFAGTTYRSKFGDFEATAQRFNGTTALSTDMAGGIAIMDGAILPTRTVTDAFALVSTDGVPNVPVTQENRFVGVTNSKGYLLVPNLTSYQRNQLAIDPLALPPDASIERTKLDIAPQRRSGALAHFGMSRYQGASVSFVDITGAPLPAGAVATLTSTGEAAIVGYDGVAFFRRLDSDNHVTIHEAKGDCSAGFRLDPPKAGDLPQLGPITCQPDKGKSQKEK